MKKIALVVITVFLTFLLASCDVSKELGEFSDALLNMAADNLQGILKNADNTADSEENSSDTGDTEDSTETTEPENTQE